MHRFTRTTAVATLSLLAWGCSDSGEQGAEQTYREPGSTEQSIKGAKTLTEQQHLPVGNLNCPLGGLKIVSGVDENRSGNLQPEEITSIRYQCTPSVPVGEHRSPDRRSETMD